MTTDDLSREEFYHALGQLSKAVDSGFDGVNRRLDTLSSTVVTHGQEIAVFKDRESQMRDSHARVTSWAAAFSAVGSWLYQLWPHK